MGTLEEIEDRLDTPQWQQAITAYRLAYAATGLSVAGFAVVVGVIARLMAQPEPPAGDDVQSLLTLSGINVAVTCGSLLAAWIFGELIAAPRRIAKRIEQRADAEGAAEQIRQAVFGAGYVRAVCVESAGLFGLFLCLLGCQDNVLRHYPVFWLNAVPAVMAAFYVAYTFPGRSHVAAQLRDTARRVDALLGEAPSRD